MIAEGLIGKTLRHEGNNGHERAVAQGQLVLAAPYLAEQYVIIELRELRGEFAERIAACGLLDSHSKNPP